MSESHRKLGKCIEVWPNEDGSEWTARQYDPAETQQILHGGFKTAEEAANQYGGGTDPEWPVFVLTAPPSDAAPE